MYINLILDLIATAFLVSVVSHGSLYNCSLHVPAFSIQHDSACMRPYSVDMLRIKNTFGKKVSPIQKHQSCCSNAQMHATKRCNIRELVAKIFKVQS